MRQTSYVPPSVDTSVPRPSRIQTFSLYGDEAIDLAEQIGSGVWFSPSGIGSARTVMPRTARRLLRDRGGVVSIPVACRDDSEVSQ